ncbi:competence protein [Virgibacillus indicus]|uniref:Competence protein n=1 Tax=Virgibacillus indicus TaxID=2024554 RepID=A0A265NBH3_9BACI|nr:ComF family protein [Virgibacillus indicus]OZU88804.1 competence protein [Virgibacillus indicus]
MQCLWCHEQIMHETSWKNLLLLDGKALLCQECKSKMEVLSGKCCSRCSRITNEEVCSDCRWWEKQSVEDPLMFNHSVFNYNAFMQELIAKWKYRGDYFLGNAFKEPFVKSFRKKFTFLEKNAIAVPIPLSTKRLTERAFNQAQMLADFLPIETCAILSRKHGEKQSKKTRYERIFTKNPFAINETINNPVVLVDDIYTTGTTLRHAASLLKEHGCTRVYACTLVRG